VAYTLGNDAYVAISGTFWGLLSFEHQLGIAYA